MSICCLSITILYETLKFSYRFISVAFFSVKSWFLDNSTLGFRFHVYYHVTFDVNKPRKFGHWVELAAHVSKLRLWKFFLINFPLSRSVSTLKIDIFLLLFILSFIVELLSFWNHLEGKQNSFTGPLSYHNPEKRAPGPEKAARP